MPVDASASRAADRLLFSLLKMAENGPADCGWISAKPGLTFTLMVAVRSFIFAKSVSAPSSAKKRVSASRWKVATVETFPLKYLRNSCKAAGVFLRSAKVLDVLCLRRSMLLMTSWVV